MLVLYLTSISPKLAGPGTSPSISYIIQISLHEASPCLCLPQFVFTGHGLSLETTVCIWRPDLCSQLMVCPYKPEVAFRDDLPSENIVFFQRPQLFVFTRKGLSSQTRVCL